MVIRVLCNPKCVFNDISIKLLSNDSPFPSPTNFGMKRPGTNGPDFETGLGRNVSGAKRPITTVVTGFIHPERHRRFSFINLVHGEFLCKIYNY